MRWWSVARQRSRSAAQSGSSSMVPPSTSWRLSETFSRATSKPSWYNPVHLQDRPLTFQRLHSLFETTSSETENDQNSTVTAHRCFLLFCRVSCLLCAERAETAAGQASGFGCSQNATKESQDGRRQSGGKRVPDLSDEPDCTTFRLSISSLV